MFKLSIGKLKEFNLLQSILYTWGTPGMKPNNNLLVFIIHVISVAIMFANHLYTFALHVHELGMCLDFQCSKVVTSLIMWRLFTIANWYSMHLKRNQVQELLTSVKRLEKKYKAIADKNKLTVNFITIGILLILAYLLAMVLAILCTDPATTNKRFDGMTFRTNTNSSSRFDEVTFSVANDTVAYSFKVATVFCILITRLSNVALTVLLTVFYTSWCYSLTQVLELCGEQLKLLSSVRSRDCHISSCGSSRNTTPYTSWRPSPSPPCPCRSVPILKSFYCWSSIFIDE